MTSHSPPRRQQQVPRFTVWQIYLLSELKNSGLTNEEIQIGVQEIDDLASNRPHIRFNKNQQQQSQQNNNSNHKTKSSTNNHHDHYNNGNNNGTTNNNNHSADTDTVIHTNGGGQPSRKRTRETSNHGESASSNAIDNVATSNGNSYYGSSDFASMVYRRGANSYSTLQVPTPVSAVTAVANNTSSFVLSPANCGVDDDEVLDPEVAELLSLDVAVVKQQIQEFMAERKITQSYIVKATNNKVSQPYISTWLLNPRSRNFRKVKILYQWYVNERRKKNDDNLVGANNSSSTNSLYNSMIYSNSTTTTKSQRCPFEDTVVYNDLKSSVWPSHCEAYLENVYKVMEMPPDEMKLVDIASECTNQIRDHYTQQGHISRDLVTTSHVAQWFQNRMSRDEQQLAVVDNTSPQVFEVDLAEQQEDEEEEEEEAVENEEEDAPRQQQAQVKQEELMVSDVIMTS